MENIFFYVGGGGLVNKVKNGQVRFFFPSLLIDLLSLLEKNIFPLKKLKILFPKSDMAIRWEGVIKVHNSLLL